MPKKSSSSVLSSASLFGSLLTRGNYAATLPLCISSRRGRMRILSSTDSLHSGDSRAMRSETAQEMHPFTLVINGQSRNALPSNILPIISSFSIPSSSDRRQARNSWLRIICPPRSITSERLVHPQNTAVPNLVTVEGIVTLRNVVQS